MSRRSTSTLRDRPVEPRASVSGAFRVHAETFTVETAARLQILDLTDRVMAMVRGFDVQEGLVHLFSMHTTCALFINEHQRALVADIESYLQKVVDPSADWLHNDPEHSDCDRQNAAAHLQALWLGHGLTLQLHGGEVVLGHWQRVLLAELDGPRTRTLRLSVMGAA